MQYNLDKIAKKYGVTLDEDQEKVLDQLLNFLKGPEHEICLSGRAGVGKSLIFNILYDFLDQNNIKVCFVTPTNKSKAVLVGNDQMKEARTIHSLLNLRPNVEIMDYDASQLKFDFGIINKTKVPSYDVLLIDECSMVNDDIYDLLLKCYPKSKIIWGGDANQISPINQDHTSKSFNCKVLELTKVYRQPESKLYKVLEYLRKKPLRYFKNVEDKYCNIIVYNDIMEMINKYAPLYLVSKNFKDRTLVKLITYTNNRIQALNEIIRKKLYRGKDEYHEGELLTTYDKIVYDPKHVILENSLDYIVKYVHNSQVFVLQELFEGYELTLTDGEQDYVVKILSKRNPESKFNRLAQKIEELRVAAVQKKQSAL